MFPRQLEQPPKRDLRNSTADIGQEWGARSLKGLQSYAEGTWETAEGEREHRMGGELGALQKVQWSGLEVETASFPARETVRRSRGSLLSVESENTEARFCRQGGGGGQLCALLAE